MLVQGYKANSLYPQRSTEKNEVYLHTNEDVGCKKDFLLSRSYYQLV